MSLDNDIPTMSLAAIPTVYYPWSYLAAKTSKLVLGAVYDDYGKDDVVDYVHNDHDEDTIKAIDKKITFATWSEIRIKRNIDINTLKCNDGFIDTRDFSRMRSIVPLETYQNMMEKIKLVDLYINNSYCYVNFLKWAINTDMNTNIKIHNNNKLVCVGHSNKMQNLENIIKTAHDISEQNVSAHQEKTKVYVSPITQITFIRHGYSCNNATEETNLDKDWDPSLTIYGILSAIKMGTTIAKTYSKYEKINVCVSPLLRTWQTAILLFGNNYDTINLNICRYLTEAYPPIGPFRAAFGRGNTPIEFRWQLKKLYHFLQLLLQNKKSLGFNTDASKPKLKNINIKFFGMNHIYTTSITINGDDIIFKYNDQKINMMTGQKTTVYANEDWNNSVFTGNTRIIGNTGIIEQDDQDGFEELRDADSFDREHHNMWRIELTVDNNMIKKTKIISGIPKPNFKTKNCEKGCAFIKRIIKSKTRYNKEKCDKELNTVVAPISNNDDDDDDKIIDDAFDVNDNTSQLKLKKPSIFSRIKHIITRKTNNIIPSNGGKKNHRKTAKKSSRKTRRKSRH